MAQARKQLSGSRGMSPRQAAACCRPVDDLLDPVLFKALGDPTRVRLLGCLAKCARPCSVTELAGCCSVDLSVVSRHLQALARAGLAKPTKTGRAVTYLADYERLSSRLRALADAIDDCRPAPRSAACTGGCRAGC